MKIRMCRIQHSAQNAVNVGGIGVTTGGGRVRRMGEGSPGITGVAVVTGSRSPWKETRRTRLVCVVWSRRKCSLAEVDGRLPWAH